MFSNSENKWHRGHTRWDIHPSKNPNAVDAQDCLLVKFMLYFSFAFGISDVVHIFFQCTGSTHLFCFMVLCFMCYSICWPLYPLVPSWRELWDQSVSYSWFSFLQQLMQFSISLLPSWWIIILYILVHILWMNAPLAFPELYSQWLSLRQVWVECNIEGTLLLWFVMIHSFWWFIWRFSPCAGKRVYA
jgi:hypothetical protein